MRGEFCVVGRPGDVLQHAREGSGAGQRAIGPLPPDPSGGDSLLPAPHPAPRPHYLSIQPVNNSELSRTALQKFTKWGFGQTNLSSCGGERPSIKLPVYEDVAGQLLLGVAPQPPLFSKEVITR